MLMVFLGDKTVMYTEYSPLDTEYQHACLWWTRLAQLAFISVWMWTLCGIVLLARVLLP